MADPIVAFVHIDVHESGKIQWSVGGLPHPDLVIAFLERMKMAVLTGQVAPPAEEQPPEKKLLVAKANLQVVK